MRLLGTIFNSELRHILYFSEYLWQQDGECEFRYTTVHGNEETCYQMQQKEDVQGTLIQLRQVLFLKCK